MGQCSSSRPNEYAKCTMTSQEIEFNKHLTKFYVETRAQTRNKWKSRFVIIDLSQNIIAVWNVGKNCPNFDSINTSYKQWNSYNGSIFRYQPDHAFRISGNSTITTTKTENDNKSEYIELTVNNKQYMEGYVWLPGNYKPIKLCTINSDHSNQRHIYKYNFIDKLVFQSEDSDLIAYITDLIKDCKLRAQYNSILFQPDFDVEKDTKRYSNPNKIFDIYNILLSLKHNKNDTKLTKIWNKYYHQFKGYCHLNDINKFINIFEFCVKNLYDKPA
eukprot:379009_1